MIRFPVAIVISVASVSAVAADRAGELLSAYSPRPSGYVDGPGHARPDTSVPFRWHSFHAGAVDPFDGARTETISQLYNPLDGAGVKAEPGAAVTFVAENAVEGGRCLRAAFTEAAIRADRAAVVIQGIAGEPSFSNYLRGRGQMNTASCYGPHWRRICLSVFNPQPAEVRVRVAGVPMVVPSGRSTLAVRTVDAVDRGYACLFNTIRLSVTAPAADTVLFLDDVRVEQERLPVLSARGRLLQFPGRAEAGDPPVLWPGFVAVEADSLHDPKRGFGWTAPIKTRRNSGHSFRSNENGILWGHVSGIDASLRVDMPPGRYGLWVFGAPTGGGFKWSDGLSVKANGRSVRLLDPRTPEQVRSVALSGEEWDWRPGTCAWESLVRPVYYPRLHVVWVDAGADGHIDLVFPNTIALHALAIFAEADKEPALAEIGRLEYLLAESWDVSHPWIKGNTAARAPDGSPYIGAHEEQIDPTSIERRLRALPIADRDLARGFLPFVRGLTEPMYVDGIPSREEVAVDMLAASAVAGGTDCVTLGLLPLRETSGLKVLVDDLVRRGGGGRIASTAVGVRISRQHQKTMQFGHHNHDYNLQEHYLIRRVAIDLHPGAARRIYFDIAVPGDAAPGSYEGRVTIASASGTALHAIPLMLEVPAIRLDDPPAVFASSLNDGRLRAYGFNATAGSYDDAVKSGMQACVSNLGHVAQSFQGKPLGWSNAIARSPMLREIVAAGRAGNGPRAFFGGPAPGSYGNPKAAEISAAFFDSVLREVPGIDLPGRTFPVFFHGGYKNLQTPHEWIVLAGAPTPSTPAALAEAAGRDFWFIDGIRASKEQAGRFTFGVWMWRIGATGRFTTVEAHLQYGGGTARPTLGVDPYFTLLDVTTCNIDKALMPALDGGVNPSRDLILIRQGIEDYRYLHTLERAIARAAPGAPGLAEAERLRADIRSEVSTDLADHYAARAGAYGENWFPRADNPWNDRRFQEMRRRIVGCLLALRR